MINSSETLIQFVKFSALLKKECVSKITLWMGQKNFNFFYKELKLFLIEKAENIRKVFHWELDQ